MYSLDMMDKGMIHIPGRMGQDGTRFHHTTQNHVKLKTYELYISGIFSFNIFRLWLTLGN